MMMMYKRYPLVLALTLAVSACSFFKKECTGADCNTPQLLEHKPAEQAWYCYGKEDQTWDCVNKPDPERVVAVVPQNITRAVPPPAPTQREPDPEPVPEPDQEPANEPAAETAVASAPTTAMSQDALLDQPRDFYTVQLIALPEEEAVLEYARANGLLSPLYARISNDGERWYVLLLGVYADLDAAEDAKEQWERTKALKVQPWIRRLGPLQDAMRLASSGT